MRNLLIVGYPRSGNTWIGYLLSYYFNAPYYDAHIEEKMLSGRMSVNDNASAYEYNWGGFLGEHCRADQEKEIRSVIKSHSGPRALFNTHPKFLASQEYHTSDSLAMVIRNPKDVAVSYFYFSYFFEAYRDNHWSTHLHYVWRDWFYRRAHFRHFSLKVANDWSYFTKQWLEHVPLVIRYEDLLVDPVAEIKRLTHAFGLKYNREYAKEAKEFCSMARMRRLEGLKSHSFPVKKFGIRVRQNERFFRSGKEMSWPKYFSPRLSKQFDRVTGELAGEFGYTGCS